MSLSLRGKACLPFSSLSLLHSCIPTPLSVFPSQACLCFIVVYQHPSLSPLLMPCLISQSDTNPFSVTPSRALSRNQTQTPSLSPLLIPCLVSQSDTNTSVSILMSCLTDSNPFSVSLSHALSCLTIRYQPHLCLPFSYLVLSHNQTPTPFHLCLPSHA